MGNKEEKLKQIINEQPDRLIMLSDLSNFQEELLKAIVVLLKQPASREERKWLRSIEVRKMLKISPGTLQNLRINGTLPYTKVGGVMYYQATDIEQMMKKGSSNAE